MKLRLQRNSLRLRLTRSEVARLCENGAVEESVDFGAAALTYRLQTAAHSDPIQALFQNGAVTVSVARQAADAWAGSDEVGIYAHAGEVLVSIEKDFRCLTRPLDDHERDTYPNPAEQIEV